MWEWGQARAERVWQVASQRYQPTHGCISPSLLFPCVMDAEINVLHTQLKLYHTMEWYWYHYNHSELRNSKLQVTWGEQHEFETEGGSLSFLIWTHRLTRQKSCFRGVFKVSLLLELKLRWYSLKLLHWGIPYTQTKCIYQFWYYIPK